MRMSTILGLAALAWCLSVTAATAATTRYVDDNRAQCPHAQFTKIQPAIDASAPGDQVIVCDGQYGEFVTIPSTKSRLRLTSQNTGGAIITTRGRTDQGTLVHVDGAKDVLVLKFQLLGKAADPQNNFDEGDAVLVDHSGSALIRDNTMGEFAFGDAGLPTSFGVLVDHAQATIIRNTISLFSGSGVQVQGQGAFAHVGLNTISEGFKIDNTQFPGVVIGDGASGFVAANSIGLFFALPETGGQSIVLSGGDARHGRTTIRSNEVTRGGIVVNDWYGFGNAAKTLRDTIKGNHFTGDADDEFFGILLTGHTTGMDVSNNTVRTYQTGLAVNGSDLGT